MSDVTKILSQIEQGNHDHSDQLLTLVYDDLRRLAAHRIAAEDPGLTLQATALVHEAYVRLVDVEQAQHWSSRGHFFSAAAEAMRRILVERARKKCRRNGIEQASLSPETMTRPTELSSLETLMLEEALTSLEARNPQAAELVKLRFFAGMTVAQTAETLRLPVRTTERLWIYARTWLHRELEDSALDRVAR